MTAASAQSGFAWRDLAIGVAVMAVWGGNFPATKEALDQVPPIFLVALRFALVGLVVFAVPLPSRLHLRALLALSCGFCTLHFSTQFTALRLLDASTTAVLAQLQVPLAAIMAAVLHHDRPGPRRLLGMLVSFAGAVVIVGEPRLHGDWLGVALSLIAALAWAWGSVRLARMAGLHPLTINGWMSLFAAPQLLLVSALVEENQVGSLLAADWRPWFALFYMTVPVTLIGYGLWYGLVRRYPVSLTIPLTLLVPVFGVLGSVLLLDERLTGQFVVGAAATLLGVAIIVLQRPGRSQDARNG